MIKISELLNNDITPFLFGTFFSRRVFTSDNRYIYTYTYYKESRVIQTEVYKYENYDKEYLNLLNKHSGNYNYWNTKDYFTNLGINLNVTGQCFFVVENDINITKESLYNKLYSKLISTCDWIFDNNLNEEKKEFIRGMVELRGSIDTTANYIATDYYADSNFELRKARMMVDYIGIPHYVTNFNFRDLQHDYTAGINLRNDQYRLNAWWYMEHIGILNAYKAEIFAKSRNVVLPEHNNDIFYFSKEDYNIKINNNLLDDRLNFYFTNLLDREPTEEDITRMRKELGFDGTPTSIRSIALIETIRYSTPDECACCKNRYNILERTHINPRTNRPYFEIHHVISIGKNKELDDENNMVKLCPGCHRSLKRGSALESVQKELIKDIFTNEPKTLTFAKHFFDSNDVETIIQKTYENLK